jgi:hypothetical protein
MADIMADIVVEGGSAEPDVIDFILEVLVYNLNTFPAI